MRSIIPQIFQRRRAEQAAGTRRVVASSNGSLSPVEEDVMRTPASIAGHPIHAMLIVFPVALFIFSLVCDLASLRSAEPDKWLLVSLYTMVGGFVGALAAAIPGLIDYSSLHNRDTKRLATIHMAINLIAVALYAINIWMRTHGSPVVGLPLALSVVAVGGLAVSGWLGGHIVHVHGVGVENAPEYAGDTAARTARAPAGATPVRH
jgi:uncharacterized membrane protein